MLAQQVSLPMASSPQPCIFKIPFKNSQENKTKLQSRFVGHILQDFDCQGGSKNRNQLLSKTQVSNLRAEKAEVSYKEREGQLF